MEKDFWLHKWEIKQIGFHKDQVNPVLVKYFHHLKLSKGARVLVPLCGKTLDIKWLLDQGYQVVGIELSKIAIDELFAELALEFTQVEQGKLIHYQAQNIDIYIGDLFDTSADLIGKIDAVYDRAALVALPLAMRKAYTYHLLQITHHAPQLLLCFEYDQTLLQGPPFSITQQEVSLHYQTHMKIVHLESHEVAGGLKRTLPAQEHVYLITIPSYN